MTPTPRVAADAFPFRPDRHAADLAELILLCEVFPQEAHAHLASGAAAAWLRAAGYPGPSYLADGLGGSGLPALACVGQFLDGCRPYLAAVGTASLPPADAPDRETVAAGVVGAAPAAAAAGLDFDRYREWAVEGGGVGARVGRWALGAAVLAVPVLYWVLGGWDGVDLPAPAPIVLLGLGLLAAAAGGVAGSAVGAVCGAVGGLVGAHNDPAADVMPEPEIRKGVAVVTALLGLAGGFVVARHVAADRSIDRYARLVREADALRKAGSPAAAVEGYGKAAALDPGRHAAYFGRGQAQLDARAYADAVADFTRVIELQTRPGRAEPPDGHDLSAAYYNRAIGYRSQRDHARAVADLTEAIRLFPFGADAFRLRAECYRATGERAKAEADLAQAAKLDPGGR
ncbi:tetratricopeptide repeat protein [Urbifossiella limnaea]|uniref:Tetratricopeptide repeat protein n=1 Tax=Urbifossiella limnaea TaxID=2528023 RepID=A0A517XUZ7_9BACT|nr:tetratricopeptide repeat protein [Urbifossiella limnaea]QDU21341.1 Tetratricopeptide repeat protein [Urbifossiella limnaea]